MKTIGVIGGMGPQATMDFEARVHDISQRLLPQFANTGYPPMVVYYHRNFPLVLGADRKPIEPYQPEPHLQAILGKLGQLVDFIVMPTNAPHLFRTLIEETSGRKVLSMIDIVVKEVRQRNWQRVGVIGFGEPTVYRVELERVGIACETLPNEVGGVRDRLDQSILALMAGQAGLESKESALEAVTTLRARSVDGLILGCTEIPLLLGEAAQAKDLINPAQLLAEAAVRFAIE